MKPLILKGHERPLTSIVYSREGDLLFTASKHPTISVWWTDNGERLGTYNGHNGAIWQIDVDRHTTRLLSASADNTVRLWDVERGKELTQWHHRAPVRSVNYALGDDTFVSVTDQVLGYVPGIYVWDVNQRTTKPAMEIQTRGEAKILQASWGDLNKLLYTANEDGTVRIFDMRKGEQLKVIHDHTKACMQLSWNKKGTLFVTASKDGTAKLYDAKTFQCLKTYTTGRPINSASISPIKEEVAVAGGQSAESVTTTRVDSAQFRTRFFHMIYEEELGSVQGHFGPVNVVTYSPDGKGFTTGGEDGYVRLHHFDAEYFTKFGVEESSSSSH